MFKEEILTIKKITDKLKKSLKDELIAVIAFGSRVRGEFKGGSDFDLLIVVRQRNSDILNKIIDIFHEFEIKSNILLSPVVKSLNAFEKEKTYRTGFFRNIEREGILFYGKT